MTRKQLGAIGEAIAIRHLIENNYSVVETNWHCQRGEIDIVAKDDNIWVFCEVKTRKSRNTETAFASITQSKREKLVATVHHYLHQNELHNVIWRIDAIAIAIRKNQPPLIDHVEDVLDW